MRAARFLGACARPKLAEIRATRASAWLLSVATTCLPAAAAVDFAQKLFGEPSRIAANIITQNVNNGYVWIKGAALNLASQPLWDFGYGTLVRSWFPAAHTFAPARSN